MAIPNRAKLERRERTRNLTRAAILDAARRVAQREGARNLSLRATAAEAGFAPAALYGYFAGKDDILLALASEDLAAITRAMRAAAGNSDGKRPLQAASEAALRLLSDTETIAAASSALPPAVGSGEPERIFNGRLIAALSALSHAAGGRAESRDEQSDVVLVAAALTGLAVLARLGRLAALGFEAQEIVARLDARFSRAA
ncbi:MAG: TetR/AcrR family transcriptional regulator [Rhizomicrobium sp.]